MVELCIGVVLHVKTLQAATLARVMGCQTLQQARAYSIHRIRAPAAKQSLSAQTRGSVAGLYEHEASPGCNKLANPTSIYTDGTGTNLGRFEWLQTQSGKFQARQGSCLLFTGWLLGVWLLLCGRMQEGKNCERFQALYGAMPRVRTPGIKWPLTSRRVLTMEWIEGVKLTNKAVRVLYCFVLGGGRWWVAVARLCVAFGTNKAVCVVL